MEFEKISLTDFEHEKLLPLITSYLQESSKLDPVNSISIEGKLLEDLQQKVSSVRIRKVINYIRVNMLIKNLLAGSKGYYVSEDPKEIKDYIRSLDGRIEAIRKVRESFIIPR